MKLPVAAPADPPPAAAAPAPPRRAAFAGTGWRALPRRLLVGAVRGYRLLLSPWLGSACRFHPTCSAYALEALERHGAATGSLLAARRLLRCHPWCAGGCDPVPELDPARRAAPAAAAPPASTDSRILP